MFMEFIENKIPRIEKKEMCKLTASETASIL